MNRKMLSHLAFGKRLHLGLGGRKRDRRGWVLAHLRASDGTWIQGEMLRFGCAGFSTLTTSAPRRRAVAAGTVSSAARHGILGHAF